MQNNNLVPEKRTDKNGVTSTRWVKPSGEADSRLTGVPAPTVMNRPKPPSDELLKQAATAYAYEIEEDYADDDEYMEDIIAGTIEAFSILPESVVTEIAKGSENASFIKYWGLKLLIADDEMDDELILDYLKVSELLAEQDFESPEDAIRFTVSVTKGYYGLTPHSVTGEYPQERMDQIEALMLGTSWLETLSIDGDIPESALDETTIGRYSPCLIITDSHLSRLLIDRSGEREAIIDFIRDRKSTEVDAITEVLDAEVQAMSNGVL